MRERERERGDKSQVRYTDMCQSERIRFHFIYKKIFPNILLSLVDQVKLLGSGDCQNVIGCVGLASVRSEIVQSDAVKHRV